MRKGRYAVLSTAWLFIAGGLGYLCWVLTDWPHELVAVLYVLSAASFVGSTVWSNVELLRPTRGVQLFSDGEFEMLRKEIEAVRTDLAKETEERKREMEALRGALTVPRPRAVTSLVLGTLGVLFGTVASLLWAAGIA